MLETYLNETFGIWKEDILISPATHQQMTIADLIFIIQQHGAEERVLTKVKSLKYLGRKGVITYLTTVTERAFEHNLQLVKK